MFWFCSGIVSKLFNLHLHKPNTMLNLNETHQKYNSSNCANRNVTRSFSTLEREGVYWQWPQQYSINEPTQSRPLGTAHAQTKSNSQRAMNKLGALPNNFWLANVSQTLLKFENIPKWSNGQWCMHPGSKKPNLNQPLMCQVTVTCLPYHYFDVDSNSANRVSTNDCNLSPTYCPLY